MKKNVTGSLLLCEECGWVGTVSESFQWDSLDDRCPKCENSDLVDVLTDLEPEEYRETIKE